MRKNKFNPHIFIRFSPTRVSDFKALDCDKIAKIIDGIVHIERLLQNIGEKGSESLHTLIQGISSKNIKYKVLQLKRDIYNNKNIDIKQYQKIANNLDLKSKSYIDQYIRLKTKLGKYNFKYFQTYQAESIRSKKTLRKIIQNKFFFNGLLLSSKALYQCKDEETKKVNRSLYRYLSRMYFKTSPFSTFTFTSIFNLNHNEFNSQIQKISLNIEILSSLEKALFSSKYRSAFTVRINPTIKLVDNYYKFLSIKDKKEKFQLIEFSPKIQIIYDLLKNKKNCLYKDLLSDLSLVEEQSAYFNKFINSLIDYGFLECGLGIPYTHSDWDELLLTRLSSAFPKSDVCIGLHKIFNIKKRLLGSSIKKKEFYLEQIRGELIKIFNKLYYPIPQNLLDNRLVYEDNLSSKTCTLEYEEILTLKRFFKVLHEHICSLDYFSIQRRKLLKFFKNHFKNKQAVPLLVFYESYIRKYSLIKEKKDDYIENILLSLFKQKYGKYKLLPREIYLDIDKDIDITTTVNSNYAYFQIYKESNNLMCVLNDFAPGNGRNISHYLSLLPEKYLKSVKANNKASYKDSLIVENVDNTPKNINFHPPLTNNGLDIPDSGWQEHKNININEVDVVMDSSADQLILKHRLLNKKIMVLNFSMTSVLARQNFYQFLNLFSPQKYINLKKILSPINDLYTDNESQMINLPRIIINNKIVVQRKKWVFTKKSLSFISKNTKIEILFKDIYMWKAKHGLPNEVFFRIENTSEFDTIQKWPRSDYKPQYLCFTNIISVEIFIREILKTDSNIEITEMLPTSLMVEESTKNVEEYCIEY